MGLLDLAKVVVNFITVAKVAVMRVELKATVDFVSFAKNSNPKD